MKKNNLFLAWGQLLMAGGLILDHFVKNSDFVSFFIGLFIGLSIVFNIASVYVGRNERKSES